MIIRTGHKTTPYDFGVIKKNKKTNPLINKMNGSRRGLTYPLKK